MMIYLKLYFENGEDLAYPLEAVKFIDITNKRSSSKLIVIDSKEGPFDRILNNKDIVSIKIFIDTHKIGKIKIAWVQNSFDRYESELQKSALLSNGDLVIGFKGSDAVGSPDEWFAECIKNLEAGKPPFKRVPKIKRGMNRKYDDYSVPVYMLKRPKTTEQMELYKQRVIDYYDKYMRDYYDGEDPHTKIIPEKEFEYFTVKKDEREKDDMKSREYLDINVDWEELGLPRTVEEYYLSRFRDEFIFDYGQWLYDNNDYGI